MGAFEEKLPGSLDNSIVRATDSALRSIPTWKQRHIRILLPTTPMVRGRMNHPQRLWRFVRRLMWR